ncbi:MAG: Protein-tyrosine-phosphatase [Anaerocolumna sp.]|jgi:protein-tyrosine phosphatase|nr:Protein-tyrosine-phosphatase [Anaerocolumna sp.]
MEGFIDIHSHILPQLDDGSSSMEQTLRMLKIAYDDGIRTMIATPHAHDGRGACDKEVMEQKLKDVKEAIKDTYPGMKLYLGSEIYYSHDSIKKLNDKKYPAMADTKYVLVEFSPMAEFRYIKNGLQEFILDGFNPIVAHVERYYYVVKDLERVDELIQMGACIQVNAASITGEFGKEYQGITKKLIKNNFIHFLSTDAHSDGNRAPRLKKCVDYLTKKYGEEYISEILIHNAEKLLLNQYI